MPGVTRRARERETQPASPPRRGVPRRPDSTEAIDPPTLLEHLHATAGNRAIQGLLAPAVAERTDTLRDAVAQRQAPAPVAEGAQAKPQNAALVALYERAVIGNLNLAMGYLDPATKPKKADFQKAQDFLYQAVASNHSLVEVYETTDPLLFERLSAVTQRAKFIAWEISPYLGKDEPTEVDILHGWAKELVNRTRALPSQLH